MYFISFLFILIKAILWLISPIIGNVQWSTPSWLLSAKKINHQIGGVLYKYKTAIGSLIFLAFIGLFSGNYAYHWYLNRPKPIEAAPIITNTYSVIFYKPITTNSPLIIKLKGHNRSPAPLELINKEITQGISITPEIEGKWLWSDDKTITFIPVNKTWPLGVKYTVTLDDSKLLTANNYFSKSSINESFVTPDFKYTINNSEFYQDPINPDIRNAIYTIYFSHPVDRSSFEKNITLSLFQVSDRYSDNDNFIKNINFTVTYNDKETVAYVKSEQLDLLDKPSYVKIAIDKGVKSILGGNESSQLSQNIVSVPDKYNLNIVSSDISLVDTSNQKIQQVLIMSLTHAVKAKDLANVINVWQLPVRDDDYRIRYYDELSRSYKIKLDVTPEILAKSTKLTLKPIDTELPYQNQISFEFKAAQNSQLYIEVISNSETSNSPLFANGGYELKNNYYNIANVPSYPSYLKFAAEGSLLSLSGDKKISVVSRNMTDLKLEIDRLIPSQLQHLVSFNDSYYYNKMNFGYLDNDHFVEKYFFTKNIVGSPEEVKYTDINLSRYLTENTSNDEMRGIFLVNLYGKQKTTDNDDDYQYIESRFIVVTDMGIITKKSLDQSHDVFVQSIRTGEPINGAKVSVLGMNGIEITSLVTDDTGHVHFSPFSNYYQGIKPLLFVVGKDQDLSFLPIQSDDRMLELSRFDIGGIQETIEGGELRSHLFSDRGIYRPGDTFHIGMIVRAQKWANSLAGLKLEAEIYDPKSNLVSQKQITLDNLGFNDIEYKTSYASPTGEWYINLYLKNPKQEYRTLLGSTSVVVREFEPDKTTVSLNLLPKINEGWLKPNDIKAEIEAKNLFGTAAADRRVTGTLILEPSTPYFKKYENYSFYQSIRDYQNSFKVELDEQETDDNGKVTIDLSKNMNSFEGNYTLRMLTEVFEPDSGRSVAATTTTFISPNDYLVGAKADGNLNYITRDAIRNLDVIAINSALEKISLTNLKIVILEQKYLSVLVKQSSGVYKYESKQKNIVLSEQPFEINNDKTPYQLDSKTPGNYIIQIKNSDDQLIYQTNYSIVGTANVTRSLDRNAELAIKINDTQYKPGDAIEIAINAPYPGSGIITIERDKVYTWKWFKSTTTSSVQTITIPEDMEGNGYINVQFIRDPSSDEIFMSPLSYGVIPFKISNEKFNDKISLTAPSLIKPGDTLPITLHTNSYQKAVIFAIDEGILQVSNYKLKDPLKSFLRKKALSVGTSQILDLILPEYRHLLALSAPGGDGDNDESLSGHLNPFKRKVDEPVAYWSGIIDVNGNKTVSYKVPDYFNGKIRIMAVSVGSKTMGHSQTSTTVRSDFVLNPNLPYFVAPNDEFEVSLSVTNLLENIGEKAIPIQVKLTASPHLTIMDDSTKVIELASMKEGVLKFKLNATENLGSGDLHFDASYGDTLITRDVSTSVRPAAPYRLKTIMGRMEGKKQTVTDLRNMYAPYSERDAAASYSPFVLSKGLATYLQDYPHYCSEQIVSRAIPILFASKYHEFDLASSSGSTPLSSLYQTLQSRQNSEGAIGLWYSTYNVDPFITLYTVNFLLEAQDAGQEIPQKLLKNANNYIKTVADSGRTDLYGLRLRAYAIYLLTRQNEITTSYLASIIDDLNNNTAIKTSWKTDITAVYLASSYQMLKMDKEANKLLKPVWQQLENAYDNAWWTNNYYDPLVVDAGKIYLISKHFADKARDIPAQALENLVVMLNKQKYTTQSSALTILALDSYSMSINQVDLNQDSLSISADEKTDGKQAIIAKLQGILAKGKFKSQDDTINFINTTSLPAWYLVSEQGFDKTIPEQPITRGLEIYREFTDVNNKPVDHVKLGETINVTVQIRTLSKEGATNMAIVDLLPGGFEVVQQPINQTAEEDNENNQEESDDDDYDANNNNHWQSPIALKLGTNTWYPDYTDVREDRVIIYGSTENDSIQKFTYQIKATSVGTYIIPPAYGEAMYDRDIQAVSKGGGYMTVEPRN